MERVEFGKGALLDASDDGAQRWEREQDFDRAMLRWMTRFAFSTAGVLSERWGVSEQRMRARLRRLEESGLVERKRYGPNEPARIVVTERGAESVGLTRRTPEGREPLGHELAIIKRVIAIERYFADQGLAESRVLTERDMRATRSADRSRPLWVPYIRSGGRQGRRRADYVVDTPDGRTAVELEFSMKGTARLSQVAIRGVARNRR
jgi:DNA-binding Lrp family transcriptional regulator